jgi:hypothetical protein
MKKYFLLFLLIAFSFSINAQFNAEKDPLITKSLASDDIKNILSETTGGNIYVTGVNAAEAKIEVYVVPNIYHKNALSEKEIRERMAADYKLTVLVDNNHKLTATAKPVDKNMNWEKSLNFSFKIFVPKNVSVNLSTSGGNINLSNLSGTLEFSTSGGNLNLEKLSGKINGTTSGGNIHVEESKDDIGLSTSGGNVYAKNCEGKLRLSTSGGSLILSDLKGDIKATTSGGNVNGSNIGGDLVTHTSGGSIMLDKMSCNLETSTSGGNIRIEVKELRQYVTVSNSGGHVDVIIPSGKGVDLKLSGEKIRTDKLANFSGKVEDDEITGKLNGGGTMVTVKGGGHIYFGFVKN